MPLRTPQSMAVHRAPPVHLTVRSIIRSSKGSCARYVRFARLGPRRAGFDCSRHDVCEGDKVKGRETIVS